MSNADLSRLTPQQQQEVVARVKMQAQNAANQELLMKTSEKCFPMCVSSPGATLSNKEQTCLAMCFDRYLEAIQVVEQSVMDRQHQ